MAHWIDNADSYICSACGYECNNPNKGIYGAGVCPQCWAEMEVEVTRNIAGYFEENLKDLVESGRVVVLR